MDQPEGADRLLTPVSEFGNRKMPSVSTLSPTHSDFLADQSVADGEWPRRRPIVRPSLRRRALRALTRYLIAVCIGVAATLAWQSYHEMATQIIASWAAQHGWLPAWLSSYAEPAKTDPPPGPKITAERPSPAATPAAASSDLQAFEAITLSLAAMRQRVEQLATTQEEMVTDISKLQAGEQDILRKISAAPPGSATAPASRPKSTTTPSSRAPTPLR